MILVGCTTVSYRMSDDPMYWSAWLSNAEAVQASVEDDVQYFAALEVDARGLEPFEPLLDRLRAIGGAWWTFALDDGVKVLDTGSRLRRIVMGHNLCGQYAVDMRASHCLFLASDTQARDDVLPRLLELKAPVAACHITTYGLGADQPSVPIRPEWHADNCEHHNSIYLGGRDHVQAGPLACTCGAAGWDVRAHMETCACMLLDRATFTRIKWRVDPDRNMTDDPSMHADVTELLHEQVLSRHDVHATHWPQQIPPIELRHSEAQRTVVRA